MGRGLNKHFLQRRYTNGQQPHEKMFNIISHLENATQTKMKYYFIPPSA